MFRPCIVPLVLLASASAVAQSFEAASVKPVQLMDLRGRYRPLEGGPGSKTPTRIGGHTTLMWMVTHAYGVTPRQVSGQAWMETAFFEVAATLAPGATTEQEQIMWQNLLKERFHFQAHRETREIQIYALVAGKKGAKLKESNPADEAADKEVAAATSGQPGPKVTMGPDGFPQIPADAKMPGSYSLSLSSGECLCVKMFCRHQTMAELAEGLSYSAGRVVQDETGLKGKYDFTLAFEALPPQAATTADGQLNVLSESGLSLPGALQEQLGLKLESKKSNTEMLVIDRVEKVPTEN